MIYVHVPFCESFCTYCDFYSELACGEKAFGAYTEQVCAEASSRRDEIENSRGVDTLYFGGGTPSVLPLSCVSRIVEAVGGTGGEFTFEVNPEDIVRKGTDYVRGLLALGVNRISMGVQSLDDGLLRWMNRRHDAAAAVKAFELLREAGVGNISVDAITGISILQDDVLADTLERLCSLRPDHVSAYQLSIEEGSALNRMIRDGQYTEASDEQCRRQYLTVCDILRSHGYRHYEISNWALPGREAVHNSAYWSRAPYVGLGPGAHSLRMESDGRQVRSWNSQSLSGWTASSEVLTSEEIREEEIMLGLRTASGWNGRRLTEEEWFVSDSIIADCL